MSSEQPISVNFPVALSIISLIHLPIFILPYWACSMSITCCCVQLAWKVSQLQYSLLKPKEKCVLGCYIWILWKFRVSVAVSDGVWSNFQTCKPTFKPGSIQYCTISFFNEKLTYLMIFSEHPTSVIFPVSGSIVLLIHRPNFILP